MEVFTISRQLIPLANGSPINYSYNEKFHRTKPAKVVKPTTQYTKSGELNIAYQVFGSGSVDLVYIPGWISNIDWMWECPELVDFLQELGKIARVILFDKRGTGLSDRTVQFSSLEERMSDIQVVMDAVDSEKAILFGHSEGGSVSTLFAATYPNRVISLITFGVFAKRRYSPDYPWAPTDEERQKVYDMIEDRWGGENMGLETLAPSKAHDPTFMNWLASYFRFGASPSAAMALTKMNTQVNIIDILGAVKVPTLILQRTNDIDVKIEEGRFMAQRIKGSKFVEFDGDDHLFWVGNTTEVLDEMKAFILNPPIKDIPAQGLITVLATKITSFRKSDSQYELISRLARHCGGKITRFEKQGFTIVFKGPDMAINYVLQLTEKLKNLKMNFGAGIYMKEGSLDDMVKIQEEDSMTKSILSQTFTGQILVTQTIKNLLSGVELRFMKHNTIFDTLTADLCSLYQLTQPANQHDQGIDLNKTSHTTSFLETVLQTIETHLENEVFSLDILSRETGVSERQLQRKIKGITNKSPNQLITSVRLKKAKELLFLQKYTVAEIAFKTGFSSPSYFSKCFKKEYGTSPTAVL